MQPVGSLLYDKKEALFAHHLREELRAHSLTPDSITEFLKGVRLNEGQYLSWFADPSKQQWFLLALENFKKEWIEQKGYIPTRAKTVAETLLQIGTVPLLKQSLDYYKKGSVYTFISYYDYVEGMLEISGAIMAAITSIEGKSQKVGDEAVIEYLKHVKALPIGVTEALDGANQKEWEFFAKILAEDPTGFTVIFEVVRQIKEEIDHPNQYAVHRILEYQSLDLFIAGARFAKAMYENLYHLWEKEGVKKYGS